MRTTITAICILATAFALWLPRTQRDARIAYLQGRYLAGSSQARNWPRRTARTLYSLAANYDHSYDHRENLRIWATLWETIELDSPYLAD